MALIDIRGVGDRRLLLQPLYRKVDTTGRVFLSTDLAGKEILVLGCLPDPRTDKKFQPMPKVKIPVEMDVFIKDRIADEVDNFGYDQRRPELDMIKHIAMDVDGCRDIDSYTMDDSLYNAWECIIQEITSHIWSQPLNSWNNETWEAVRVITMQKLISDDSNFEGRKRYYEVFYNTIVKFAQEQVSKATKQEES